MTETQLSEADKAFNVLLNSKEFNESGINSGWAGVAILSWNAALKFAALASSTQPSAAKPTAQFTGAVEDCIDEGCPHYGTSHSHPVSAAVQATKVTQFNVGRYCLSEDACINLGIDFAAYERGVSDAANAFGAVEPTAQPLSKFKFDPTTESIADAAKRFATPPPVTKVEPTAQPDDQNSFVQPVPDHCDRITWRNHYYSLPIKQQTPPPVAGDAEAKYSELIYAVGMKFSGESRHATALRYIRQAEAPNNQRPAAIAAGGKT